LAVYNVRFAAFFLTAGFEIDTSGVATLDCVDWLDWVEVGEGFVED
jgi:hypothetical protein